MKIACGVGVWKTYGRPCARSTLLRLSLVARRATRSAGSSSIFRWGNKIFVLRQFLRDLKNCCWELWFLLFGSNGVSWRIICCWFFRKFGDYLIFDWTKWFWMKWRLQSVVNLGDVVAFEFLSEIRKWFFEDNNLWFLIPSWMEQMCSDIGNIKIRLWTFQRFERLFAIMIFNFGLNEMIWIKWRLIDIISCVQQAFWYRKY